MKLCSASARRLKTSPSHGYRMKRDVDEKERGSQDTV